jgi:glycosyltransferase involved in cell wall biosynthesis
MAELPVIVSNLYEMRRLVEKNSIGVVAKENTPQGLKEAIERAVKLDRQELDMNIKRVKEIYNWEEQEKVLLNLYKGLK